MSKELTRLAICPCRVSTDGTVSPEKGKTFTVMLNPSQFSHGYAIAYNQTKALGQLASDLKFSAIQPDTVSFEILLDNTGVVEGGSDVQDQIEKLNKVVYAYDGDRHEPNHVRLLWGRFLFYGRLSAMSASYTLFTPGGEPLRARINLSFLGFMTNQEEARRANRSSPDLTHSVVFRAGDSLPLLCQRIYNDAARYVAVARMNNLTNFRDIPAGTRIVFPPLG
jgi:nucleoid-associated protein YgaU